MSIPLFPSEILTAIFGAMSLDVLDITTVSHVSRWWRNAALGASELWLNIQVKDDDVNKHPDVVLAHFRRSQPRAICLELQFTSMEPPATPSQMQAFLQTVVQPNVQRCGSLTVQATQLGWDAIFATFGQETYPLLRVLDILAVHYWTRVQPHALEEFTFALPANHPRLEELAIYGINVGDVALPRIHTLRVGGKLRGLVTADGRINRWLLQGPQRLELCNLDIPPMHFQTQREEERSVWTSSVLHLKLAQIYASRSSYGTQNDCAPFFDALQTPQIQTLELESFHGRAWEDFLFTLSTPTIKYPVLTALWLKSFDFRDLSYAGVGFFLRCFPGLESVVLAACPLSTWETVLHILMLHSALCPSTFVVEVDGVLLDRKEPLPFAAASLLEGHEKRERRAWLPEQRFSGDEI
ncbi:hypothetical protein B0H19DRAFT_1275985 [Mycena capillaripes]|nr:hypothetical protein B0H19DRAFT_1275985 [Mycena capillaripes]